MFDKLTDSPALELLRKRLSTIKHTLAEDSTQPPTTTPRLAPRVARHLDRYVSLLMPDGDIPWVQFSIHPRCLRRPLRDRRVLLGSRSEAGPRHNISHGTQFTMRPYLRPMVENGPGY